MDSRFHSPLDTQAFEELFLAYHARLVLYTYRITDDQSAAEDIVTDVFINLWNKRENLDNIQSLKAYLYTSARNRSLTWLHRVKREQERYTRAAELENIVAPPAIENMIYVETLAKIYAAMEHLPNRCRSVFILHFIEGKKIAEIAAELNISISSVRTHKGRSIELLQKLLLELLLVLFIYL